MMVRLADRVTLPALGALAAAMHDEAPNLRDVPMDEDATGRVLADLVDAGTVVIAQAPTGELVGFLLFTLCPEWWSRRILGLELGFYVAPAHRGLLLANRLVSFAVGRATEMGADYFRGGTSAGTDTEGASAVYARAGFHEVGRAFAKRLTWPSPEPA